MSNRLCTSLILDSGPAPVHGRLRPALARVARSGWRVALVLLLTTGLTPTQEVEPAGAAEVTLAGFGVAPGPAGQVAAPAVPPSPSAASEVVAAEPRARSELSLAGAWRLVLDPADAGRGGAWEQELSAGRHPPGAPGSTLSLPVPGPLEALRQTARYDGVAWLATSFRAAAASAGATQLLEFTQVNYQVTGWIDGQLVGRHEGGYDAFAWDVTDALEPGSEQCLVLRVVDPGERPVDGLTLATTPHAKESWYHNFGGVLGPVTLVSLLAAEPRIERLVARTGADGAPVVEARVGWRGPRPDGGQLLVEVVLLPPIAAGDGPAAGSAAAVQGATLAEPMSIDPASAGDAATGADLVAPGSVVLARTTLQLPSGDDAGVPQQVSLPVPDLPRWSPASPRLAALIVRREGSGLTHARRFGYREVVLDADGLRLNGARQPLRGVLYQPHWPGTGGVSPGPAELAAEVAAMKRLGFDFVRTHVRPAPPAFLDACDEQGLLVLAEPAIGWVDDDPGLAARLHHEVEWMVARDHHHPSIVAWCVLNELSGEAYRYGAELALALAAADPDARPVLEDSGAFFGGRYVPAGGDALAPMLDEHEYPPFPLPPAERARMATEADPTGPTAVSEYGYGTLVDVLDAAQTYRDRGPRWTAEAELFAGKAGGARRALEGGEGWTVEGWVAAAAERQAQAAAAMTEALRSNPALDLLCYTQWQAVSSESSAGLRDVWGAERPVAAALSAALADVLVVVEPTRRSVRAGEPVSAEVVVVNDSGATLTGELLVRGAAGSETDTQVTLGVSCPPGVTRVVDPSLSWLAAEGPAAVVRLEARLSTADGLRAESRAVLVQVESGLPTVLIDRVEAAPAVVDDAQDPNPNRDPDRGATSLALFVPEQRDDLRAFADRVGLPLVEQLATEQPWSTVVVIADPARLGERLPLAEQVRLWNHVWRGGSAVVLVASPKSSAFGRLVAGRRGNLRLPALPVDVTVASAVGHFMGRSYPTFVQGRLDPRRMFPQWELPGLGRPVFAESLDGLPARPTRHVTWEPSARDARATVHLLDEHDAVVSPVAMLVGDPPAGSRAAMLALDHLGHRIGLPIAHVPYGYGGFTFVGLPLLDPVDGEPDARRDAWLQTLVLETAAECAERVLHGGQLPGLPSPGAAVLPAELPDAEWTALAAGLEQLAQAVALEDRASVLDASAGLSPTVAAAMQGQREALTQLASGQRAAAFTTLTEAHATVWTPELAALLSLEQRVLDGVARLRQQGARDDLDTGFQAMEFWGRGIGCWFDGDADTAYAWLGRAALLVADDG